MTFLCSISGVQPEDPCLSKTGYVFERRLIEKHLAESPVCPATGEPLTTEDLIPIRNEKAVKPRSNASASIPGLLSLLQGEWDALALETFNLRLHLDELRKQLSYSLYQHDASTRVIARLLKQRDKALEEVSSLKEQLLQFRANYDLNALESGFDSGALERLQELAKVLLAERKKRDLSKFKKPEEVAKFAPRGEFRLHSSTVPGVSAVVLDRFKSGHSLEESLCFTAGNDGSVVLFDLGVKKKVAALNGHLKRVNSLLSHPLDHILLSGSDDKTVRVWKEYEDEFRTAQVFKQHKAPVKSLSLHPSGEYFLSLDADGVWALSEVDSGRIVKLHRDVPQVCTALKFHPDGLICVGSGKGNLHVWDLREEGLKDPLTHSSGEKGGSDEWVDLDFSENGYYLATLASGEVLLWDLRKQGVVSSASCNVGTSRLKFDQSGTMLGVASTKVELFSFKNKTNLEHFTTLEGHSNVVTDLDFGPGSQFVLTTSMDKSLRLFH